MVNIKIVFLNYHTQPVVSKLKIILVLLSLDSPTGERTFKIL